MGQIIIIYVARNRNRNKETHVWTLLYNLLTFYFIYIHLCIMSIPSAVNQHMLQKKNIHRATACYNNHHLWRENASHMKHTWCLCLESYIFVIVQLLSRVWLFASPRTAARASLSFTICQSLLKFMSIELVMLSHSLVLCLTLLLLSIFPSIRGFSNESALPIRWPNY